MAVLSLRDAKHVWLWECDWWTAHFYLPCTHKRVVSLWKPGLSTETKWFLRVAGVTLISSSKNRRQINVKWSFEKVQDIFPGVLLSRLCFVSTTIPLYHRSCLPPTLSCSRSFRTSVCPMQKLICGRVCLWTWKKKFNNLMRSLWIIPGLLHHAWFAKLRPGPWRKL